MIDKNFTCPNCQHTDLDHDNNNVLCLNCGYFTNEQLMEDSEYANAYLETLPKIANDLKILQIVEDKQYYWFPLIIKIPLVGMIYPEGTGIDNWNWSLASEVPIPLFQRMNYPIEGVKDRYYETRIDVENSTKFNNNEFFKLVEFLKTKYL